MNPQSPLARAQIKRLTELLQLGVGTDDSLAAFLRSVDQPCDRSVLSHYRNGRRACPIGLLDYLLRHATPTERIAILELWARPFGLAVVPTSVPSSGLGLLDLALELVTQVARVVGIARQASPSPEERRQLRLVSAEIRTTAAALDASERCALKQAA